MVDFTLVVGVDQKLSYEPFKTGIEDIIKKINSEEFGIKIKIDPTSLSEIRSQISSAFTQENTPLAELTKAYNTHAAAVQAAAAAEREKNKQSGELANTLQKERSGFENTSERAREHADNMAAVVKRVLAYVKMVQQLDSLQNKLSNYNGNGSSEVYSQIEDAKAALESIYNDLLDDKIDIPDYDIQFNTVKNSIVGPGGVNDAFKSFIDTQKKSARAAGVGEKAQSNYVAAVLKGTEILEKSSSAERSSNKERAQAYSNVKNTIKKLDDLNRAYDAGKITAEQFDEGVRKLNDDLNREETVLRRTGGMFKSWKDQFKDITHQLAQWVTPMRIIMQVIRYIKQMVSASIELNDAMTQMQIVTKASDAEMVKFGRDAAEASKRIASSITDFVSSATTYARLGYNAEESSMFAEYTAMLQNVGDIGVDDAQDAVTAIVKAFGKGAGDIKSVMDEIVQVGKVLPMRMVTYAQ